MTPGKAVLAAALLVVVVVVAVQNTETVSTRLLFADVPLPRAVLLFATAALGFVAGVVLCRRRDGKQD
jgi:uncharacterized integral membrane protein